MSLMLLLVIIVVLVLAWWLISSSPLPPNVKWVIFFVLAVFAIVYLLSKSGLL